MKNYNFYAVIIGSEILNRRRLDKHFDFLSKELNKYNHTLHASFTIKDDVDLMKSIYTLIKNDENAVMFSFGGIGSTPDDLTREIASEIFTCKAPVRHKQFEKDIIKRLGERAYPHPITMADIPEGSELIVNPINNMSGFSLKRRLFFVPGFPEMAHPMLSESIKSYFSQSIPLFRTTILAQCSEGAVINIMKELPSDLDFSSLPMMNEDSFSVELSILDEDEDRVNIYMEKFINYLTQNSISYKVL